MSLTGSGSARLRVVAVADADSFVKWSGALLDSVPDISIDMVLLETPVTVSAAQERAALAGTRIDRATRLPYRGLAGWLGGIRPDVVLIAGRAPFVRLVQRVIDTLPSRPVVVTGLPGMSIPARWGALEHRRYSDLLVLHSRRELRAFAELSAARGVSVPLGLATLPFARRRRARGAGGTDLVFAAQALVPQTRAEREEVAELLCRAAEADPSRRVVVKLRSVAGENETHEDREPYPSLLPRHPSNLVFSAAPMSEALDTAEGLVTISSTSAMEAMARGVPIIALDSFGVSADLLNLFLEDSGLLGSADDVIARAFRHPRPEWMEENYFHDPADSTWWGDVEELVRRRRAGDLPARTVPAARGGALHEAWHRKSVLGAQDRTVLGTIAGALGTPAVKLLLALKRRRHSESSGSSEIALAPAPFKESVVRKAAPRK